MKIRIKGSSLRYRLTKTDMALLANDGHLQEQTDFANQSLIYALKATLNDRMTVEFINNTITLFMPKEMVKEWVETNRVGFEDKTGTVVLLVEKDFTCVDNVEEGQGDNYPNPLAIRNKEQETTSKE